MKVKLSIFIVIVLFFFPNCVRTKKQDGETIIVAGKIDHFNPMWPVIICVNKIGFTPELITAETDSAGNFKASFESYIPLDIWVTYKTNFLATLYPGDSLFIQFDGRCNHSPELLESIVFGGDAAERNRNVAIFQKMYFSNEIYWNWDKKKKAVKEYNVDQYLQYLDTMKQTCHDIYEQFVAENNPDEASKKWAKMFSEKDFYHYLGWYVHNRKQANITERNDIWDVPEGFYDGLCNHLPIERSMLMSAFVINDFADVFVRYVYDQLRDRSNELEWHLFPGGVISGPQQIVDSIKIYSVIEFVPDPLLRQIMLAQIFDHHFEKRDVSVYERFRDVADQYIREPFLKEPLNKKFLQTKLKWGK